MTPVLSPCWYSSLVLLLRDGTWSQRDTPERCTATVKNTRKTTPRFTNRRLGFMELPADELPVGIDGPSHEGGTRGDERVAKAGLREERSIAPSWGLGKDGQVPREALDFGCIGGALPGAECCVWACGCDCTLAFTARGGRSEPGLAARLACAGARLRRQPAFGAVLLEADISGAEDPCASSGGDAAGSAGSGGLGAFSAGVSGPGGGRSGSTAHGALLEPEGSGCVGAGPEDAVVDSLPYGLL